MERFARHILSVCCFFLFCSLTEPDSTFSAIRSLLMAGDVSEAKSQALDAYYSGRDSEDRMLQAEGGYWLANCYQEEQKFETAENYYREALSLAEINNQTSLRLRILTAYGTMLSKIGDYKSAHRRISFALSIAKQTGEKEIIRACTEHLGNLFLYQERYDSARVCYERSLSMAREIGDSSLVAASLQNVGIAWLNLQEYEKAEANLLQAVKLYKILGEDENVLEAYQNLVTMYNMNEEMEKSYMALLDYLSMKDSGYLYTNPALVKQVIEIQEDMRDRMAMTTLTKVGMVITGLLMLVSLVILVRIYRQRKPSIHIDKVVIQESQIERLKPLVGVKHNNLLVTYLLIGKGLTQKQVSGALNVGESAVSKYVTEIKDILGVDDIGEDAIKHRLHLVNMKDVMKDMNLN